MAEQIRTGNETINLQLFENYAKNFRKGVSLTMGATLPTDKFFDLQAQLAANVSRFAAAKAYHVTQVLREFGTEQEAKAAMAVFNVRQITEYNTTIARTRSAKQWTEFNAPNRAKTFPNIKWLPSRSVEKRESHIKFYNRIWAKDDEFWLRNMPGTEWNCKCDMQETHHAVTDNSDIPQPPIPKGLKGNTIIFGFSFCGKPNHFR